MSQVLFQKPAETLTLGRNGYSQTHGVAVLADRAGDEVSIRPVNSRGNLTQCRIPVPRRDLPAFIELLRSQL